MIGSSMLALVLMTIPVPSTVPERTVYVQCQFDRCPPPPPVASQPEEDYGKPPTYGKPKHCFIPEGCRPPYTPPDGRRP